MWELKNGKRKRCILFKFLSVLYELMPDSSFPHLPALPEIALKCTVVDVTVIPKDIATFP